MVCLSTLVQLLRTGEDDEVLHLLAVAAVHPGEEFAEALDTPLAAALVDVVHHIVRQQGEESLALAGIEQCVVAAQEV